MHVNKSLPKMFAILDFFYDTCTRNLIQLDIAFTKLTLHNRRDIYITLQEMKLLTINDDDVRQSDQNNYTLIWYKF